MLPPFDKRWISSSNPVYIITCVSMRSTLSMMFMLPMRIPVSPAHQEETLVCYSIAYLRLERLLRSVCIQGITIVAFAIDQLGQCADRMTHLAAGLMYPSRICFQLLSAIRSTHSAFAGSSSFSMTPGKCSSKGLLTSTTFCRGSFSSDIIR
jgi:hypothetical protein